MLPKAALVRARNAIESLYTDTCTIITEKDTVNTETGIVETARVTSEEYPCRISYINLPATNGDGFPVMSQSVTLFLNPEADVPAGADVDVMRQGRKLHFKAAGVPAIYDNHQEISLVTRDVHDG